MNQDNRGILVVISGFSGVGKGTLMRELMSKHGDNYALSVSATTRAPRPGEEDGVHYFFVSTEKFEQMIEADELVEYAQYVNNYYGTPKKYVMEQMAAGRNVILEIELQGALAIKQKFPDTALVFVSAPSAEELRNRLVGRGTETEEVISQRLSRAYEESQEMDKYEYLVVNDNLEECMEDLHTLICNEQYSKKEDNSKYAVANHLDFVNKMRDELKSFSKGEIK